MIPQLPPDVASAHRDGASSICRISTESTPGGREPDVAALLDYHRQLLFAASTSRGNADQQPHGTSHAQFQQQALPLNHPQHQILLPTEGGRMVSQLQAPSASASWESVGHATASPGLESYIPAASAVTPGNSPWRRPIAHATSADSQVQGYAAATSSYSPRQPQPWELTPQDFLDRWRRSRAASLNSTPLAADRPAYGTASSARNARVSWTPEHSSIAKNSESRSSLPPTPASVNGAGVGTTTARTGSSRARVSWTPDSSIATKPESLRITASFE